MMIPAMQWTDDPVQGVFPCVERICGLGGGTDKNTSFVRGGELMHT